jgi:hypothetical protein
MRDFEVVRMCLRYGRRKRGPACGKSPGSAPRQLQRGIVKARGLLWLPETEGRPSVVMLRYRGPVGYIRSAQVSQSDGFILTFEET